MTNRTVYEGLIMGHHTTPPPPSPGRRSLLEATATGHTRPPARPTGPVPTVTEWRQEQAAAEPTRVLVVSPFATAFKAGLGLAAAFMLAAAAALLIGVPFLAGILQGLGS